MTNFITVSMIVILIVYIIRVRIFQRNFFGYRASNKRVPISIGQKIKKEKAYVRNRPIAALGGLVKQVTYIMYVAGCLSNT
jgi:hypothetical protein